jgi:NADP-dependent 3-hydroxy acid dehydrogenase YdfG
MAKPVHEQVVVVCGASSGIGRETAKRFARAGAKVVAAARSDEGLDTLEQEVRAEGAEMFTVHADVTQYTDMERLASAATERYGRIDTWAHVAGASAFGYFTDLTPEEIARTVDVDLVGLAYGLKAAIAPLQENGGGTFIAVSSVAARRSLPLLNIYSAAKHGVDGLIDAVRLELRHQKIPVKLVQVMPATINTPFFDNARTELGVKPMGLPPFYPPQAVAETIVYAAARPMREVAVGGVGKAMILSQRLSPRLTDAAVGAMALRFPGQKTNEPKSPDDPNTLFDAARADNRVEGDFKHLTEPGSLFTWFDTHPRARVAALACAAFGAIALTRRCGNGNGTHGTNGTNDYRDEHNAESSHLAEPVVKTIV